MPTASDLPMPTNPMDAFSSGTQNIIKDLMARQQLAETAKYDKGQLGIQQQAQDRAQQEWEMKKSQYDMLQNMMNGQPAQPMQPMPAQEYGQGMGMFTPEGMQDAQQQAQQQQPVGDMSAFLQSPLGRGLFHEFYGIDPASETPQQRETREIRTAGEKKQEEMNIKKKADLESEFPLAQRTFDKLERLEKIAKEYPHLFKPTPGGQAIFGTAKQRKAGLKTEADRKAWGEAEDILGDLVGQKAQEYSHRGLATTFNMAKEVKPGFEEHSDIFKSKVRSIKRNLLQGHDQATKDYTAAGGMRDYKLGADKVEAPKRPPGLRTAEQYRKWLDSLSPEQQLALAQQHGG